MNEVMIMMFQYIVAYLGICVILLFIIDWQMKGLLGTFFRVKLSNGRLILGRIITFTDTYYRTIKREEGFIKVKTRDKEVRTFEVDDEILAKFVNREMGISVVECNESFNTFRNFYDNKDIVIANIDTAGTEALIERIKNRPTFMDKREKTILIIMLLICLFLGLYTAYKIGKIEEIIRVVQNISGNV